MDCPRCGAVAGDGLECAGCGVLLAKARPPSRSPRAARLSPGPDETRTGAEAPSRWGSTLAMLALAVLAALLLLRQFRGEEPSSAAVPAAAGVEPPPAPPSASNAVPAAPLPRVVPVAVDEARLTTSTANAEDARAASALAARLRARAPIGDQDVSAAGLLFDRYGEPAASLFVATLLTAARQERTGRRYEDAARLLERALSRVPDADSLQRELLAVRSEQNDWPAAERAANAVLQRSPGDSETVQMLAYALVRQDRNREARAVLEAHLEAHPDDAVAAALLGRVRRDERSEGTLQEQALAHFNVRYDGEAHEEVGREVMGVLERHYSSLVTTFDHQPATAIPVVLLSRQAYYGSGAPAWAGGHYDSFDGRVRIPIGGLTKSLTPRLDGTVLHELTHAFVADLSAGVAPSELHEGLAQWMEGDRSDEHAMQMLVSGQMDGVSAHYLGALAFVEGLMAERGQGAINEVLAEMARSGDADAAFRTVYGSGFKESLAAARGRWRQLHGG